VILDVRECAEECLIAPWSQAVVGSRLELFEGFADGGDQVEAPRGQGQDAGPFVAVGGLPGQVAHGLELVEQRVQGLLAQPHVLGELGGSPAVRPRVAEQVEVGLAQVVEAPLDEVVEDHAVTGLGGSAQLRGQHRPAGAGVGVTTIHNPYNILDDYRTCCCTTWTELALLGSEPQ
jgi:hypothetical protein